jgi:hypothetical protein
MSMSKDEYIELRWRFVTGEPVLESTLNRMTAVGGETPVYKVRDTPSSHVGALSALLGRVLRVVPALPILALNGWRLRAVAVYSFWKWPNDDLQA